MRLEAVTAELRPRSDWEAVDLGLALVRRDFGRLYGYWWLGMLPVLLPGLLLPWHGYYLLLMLLAGWWTPVASRLVLFFLSRRLFGDRPGWKEVLRELPRAMVRRFGFRMLVARFSPWRPLTMAVEDLEGLRGKVYQQRVRLLLRRGDSTVILLAMWRLVLLAWIALAVFSTAVLFLPQGQAEYWQQALEEWNAGSWFNPPASLGWFTLVAFFFSLSVTDIFSTGAGFGIYVNHRTWIEGWDVELALRRLGNRLRGVSAMVLVGLLALAGAAPLQAAEPAPKQVIQDVKAQEDFTVHKVKIRVPNPSSSSAPMAGLGPILGVVGMALFWAIVCAVIGFVIWLIWRYRHVFRGGRIALPKRSAPVARVVMGMDVAPESLPADIPTAVMDLWRVGRRHEAMSLLYRGTISKLIDLARVEIAESDTESDCQRRVRAEATAHAAYFDGLTAAWMRLAYALQTPADAEVESLCGAWPFRERRSA